MGDTDNQTSLRSNTLVQICHWMLWNKKLLDLLLVACHSTSSSTPPSVHLPPKLCWLLICTLSRLLEYTESTVMFLEPSWDDECFVTWQVMLLEVSTYYGHEHGQQHYESIVAFKYCSAGYEVTIVRPEESLHTITFPPWGCKQGRMLPCSHTFYASLLYTDKILHTMFSIMQLWWRCAHSGLIF